MSFNKYCEMPGFRDDKYCNMFVEKTFNTSESVNFMGRCFTIE